MLELTFESQLESQEEHLDLAYWQIWLYAMCYYPKIAKDPESNNLLAKPINEKADKTVIYDMVALTQKLGFNSPRICKLV
jgi:hypothetical protein